MDCPNCGLVNHPSAVRCDCGYDFFDKAVKNTFLKPKKEEANAQKTIKINDEGYLNEIRAAHEATDSRILESRIKSGRLSEESHSIALHELSKRKIDVTDLPKTPKPEHESLDEEEMSFIFRAWYGKEKLWKVFWIYHFVTVVLYLIIKNIALIKPASHSFRLLAISILLLSTPFLIFMWVSIWRCAHNTSKRIWELATKLLVILILAQLLSTIARIFIKL